MRIMKSLGRVLFLMSCALLLVPALTVAQEAVLYELTENAQLGMSGGLYGRHAYAALQGWAKVGTPVCPPAVLSLSPNTQACTITAVGTDNVDVYTGKGTISGRWATVVQFDNPVDAPEYTVMTGSFSGDIDLSLALARVAPLGFVTNARFSVDGSEDAYAFAGVFRLPFAVKSGKRVNAKQRHDAFYLADDGTSFPVKMDERALGWPTVRFEVRFQ
jgi:hypothetical protein